jgi:hypothetical protein
MATRIAVYVPRPGRLKFIDPGSGIVGAPIGAPRTRIDYEGNRHGAVNLVTFADRVQVAAGRYLNDAPTIARAWVAREDLVLVGSYDPHLGVVTVTVRQPLAAWLAGGDLGAALDAELVTTNPAQRARRHTPLVAASYLPDVAITVPEDAWRESDGEDDPRARLRVRLLVNGTRMHLEAWAVAEDDEAGTQEHPASPDDLQALGAAVGASKPFTTTVIQGRPYVLVATPQCR